MVDQTLSLLFQRLKGAPVELKGQLVHPIFRARVKGGQKRFLIRRIHATSSPVPGLRIKVVKGEIEVNGQRHPEVILWADTSPESVSLSVISKSGCEMKAWNVWRADDLVQAWVGNAGLVISEVDHVITLECSDGAGEVDFTDLIVQIQPYE